MEALTKKFFGRYKEPLTAIPNLVEMQKRSYELLVAEGLAELFKEFSPISDYSKKKFDLEFAGFELSAPRFDEHYARENKVSYDTPLRARVKLTNKTLGVVKEQEIFMADFPIATDRGTFVINGVERVVVPQLARSFGIFFTAQELKAGRFFGAKVIPSRGAWIEIETDADEVVWVKIDRKRKFPITSLLRMFGQCGDAELLKAVGGDADTKRYIEKTLAKDPAKTLDESYVEIYRRLRDGDVTTTQNARETVSAMFTRERYDLSPVGRYRFNHRFGKPMSEKALEARILSLDDLITTVKNVVKLNNTKGAVEDDIDHLGSRRVRYVGEMLQAKLRVGMTQMKRNIQDRMSTVETDTILPINFVSPRPLQARLKEFFTTNQLSQLMSQKNTLDEVEHLRTCSAMGPGGLTKERAGLEVRDVHPSHYGRLCPIHTPEGPNIGLVLRLSTYARVNAFGVIETPYVKVTDGKITGKIDYLNALEEEQFVIAHAAVPYDQATMLLEDRVEARVKGDPGIVDRVQVQYIDVATNQAFSTATSSIPFLEHDDANRALMGSNMQRQATPCVIPEAPIVATGMEARIARDSGRVVLAHADGVVKEVDAKHIVFKDNKGNEKEHKLINFVMTNDATCYHQRPIVSVGEKVKKGGVLADTSTSDRGEMALGQNLLVAFMSWGGANYEDAIILSERLVRESILSSIHIEKFVVNVRDTKLGPEITTPDIPNVGEVKLKDLDHEGIVRIGAEVRPGDILVGKITPKGEAQLTPEERLLRSIFGEKARDVKDTSLRMEHGKRGRVIGVKVFSREKGDNLESGIIKRVYIEVAQLRNISIGDKLAGRHGNKGVISKILPIEEMPYMEDGTPIDVILTPLGVPSRMNLGQIFELHLGLAAHAHGYQAITPPFLGVTEEEICAELKSAGYREDGKMKLFDGRTGEPFEQSISVGYMYILKLHHMVEDKIHMRSIGPYSLITQQPLGGKAQGGGQRFGEMEVWALQGYGAAHVLREMLTVKSDDILGRSAAFDAIVKGRNIREPNLPATFHVLLNSLRGLALDIDLKYEDRTQD
ncbi:MAG: DNA-directed RNA polymerase subunit beta [Candidatus Lloydbacteria bacterium RIFCSPHIGHO2_02_FULL_54_17]|uniref:DNA-directed RNA polymerase subunit beta n=1 Tax=Candidatus Lloydbacteria bacterium RIFCSPHIGHO2_02_FULL_54_17 TaxID=1798664 RepID=A0A1G2DGK4_9BACT|nr:MAG: DNA-directed RNA polymerase subunit beta [Candidatus Lloydbacteria bacterium RIFCSPHIGHO2_01_FULL_54_11]OGZ12643.1 MAG: DNA-directed RNA polymerase subunit beta [Candidatus Lloydbacteria bacterium RIFCSPHIGHO2_02_FULL_54_17]OGZ13495.1 MAG: DNA-directed RNA polymerase subunit beta [Candidatus Lloydbacteria bacterium RIFCSPLOWO2_01_FULL_54_18]